MNDDAFELSTGQAHEFAMACRRNELTRADVKLLSTGDNLRRSIDFLRGNQEQPRRFGSVSGLSHADIYTFVGKGWHMKEVPEALPEKWDPARVTLEPACPPPGTYEYDYRHKILQRLAHRKFLGITALKFYWDNQHLIPEEWKELTDGHVTLIFFDGTVLHSMHGSQATWYLHWRNGRWKSGYQATTSGRKARYKSVVIAD